MPQTTQPHVHSPMRESTPERVFKPKGAMPSGSKSTSRTSPRFRGFRWSGFDWFSFGWLIFSGLIHLVIEGTWLLDHPNIHLGRSHFWTTLPHEYFPWKSNASLIKKLWQAHLSMWRSGWKEYAKGDRRYLESNTFLLAVESITTVLNGPLCILGAYSIVRNKAYRWIVIALVSIMQIYGDCVYFLTEYLEGYRHIDRSNWDLHFGLYFCGFNILWLIVPGILLVHSIRHIVRSESEVHRLKLKIH